MPNAKIPQIRKPIKLWDIIKIGFAIVLLGYVFSKTNFSQLVALRSQFSWSWFGITLFLFGAMITVKGMQYYLLIEKRLPYSRILEIVILQNALMNFVATAAGIASYLTILGLEKNVKLGRATVSFVLVKIGDLIAVLILLLCSLFFMASIPEEALRIAVIIFIFSLLILAFFFAMVMFRQDFVDLVGKLIRWLNLDRVNFIRSGVNYLDTIVGYDQRKAFRLISVATALSLVYMGLTMAWGYARLRMFSLKIDIEIVIFVLSLLQIASWIPVFVLGGLGISETLSVYLFGLFGENPVELAAVLIGIRLVVYLSNAFSLLYLPAETIIHSLRRKN